MKIQNEKESSRVVGAGSAFISPLITYNSAASVDSNGSSPSPAPTNNSFNYLVETKEEKSILSSKINRTKSGKWSGTVKKEFFSTPTFISSTGTSALSSATPSPNSSGYFSHSAAVGPTTSTTASVDSNAKFAHCQTISLKFDHENWSVSERGGGEFMIL